MKRIILTLLLLFVFSSSQVSAEGKGEEALLSITPIPIVEWTLPYAGILPDHPLYPIKQMRDKILLFVTRDPYKKVNIELILADKHLVMGSLLWERGSIDLAEKTLAQGEKYLLMGISILEAMEKDKDLPPGLIDKLKLAAKKHQEVLTRLMLAEKEVNNRQKLNEVLATTNQAIQKITGLK
ncbi:hypothetical protein A2960_05285 [Candidatus Gottesmanbacteria bacterium RIFCSPLOWO2_01_FULL_39_12b]|uniref:DUF5667 domain-containing protein n=1 Tax=Candidatus Gottesmanbacteria bacterium RIFCSPLOWO2_01_FULL_39_12b TaxID=1798388 RepID=A0A1F6AM24_9BACT|nr:MAG: hypothetical protein A2960_05285 [Candidatus Gottesmanbacteria bacterium RIFCSPLOWO2_01_FULL_39_12b]